MTVTLWAPAKLTLSLRITGVRPDGLHLIDAEMVTLDLADRLDVDPGGDGVCLADGTPPPDGDGDLVVRALRLARRTAAVTVHKTIPPGAGLGGGSADAAAILRWAQWPQVPTAAVLGADVPFCLIGGRARVTGIGEWVEALRYERRTLTLATPPFGCSTPVVYAAWDRLGGPQGPNGNDLEPAALEVDPRLAEWRDRLGDASGQTPRLAGSGSTWFVEGSHPGPGFRVVTTTPSTWPGPEAP